jgi:hypothetical protein
MGNCSIRKDISPTPGDLVHPSEPVALEFPRRLDELAAVKPKAGDLLAGQNVEVFKSHAACEAEQPGADPHLREVSGDHVVGTLVSALTGDGNHGRIYLERRED